ncbi:hypothetical protein [Falsiroseomonas tokyonensis]|uniref:Uncharacterized protein n=1 Tax=Falsiroseomonas tokyonensis TaxID=430521 RepID=A0ABV7BRK5_9PROT|nr:hypothetical protein [Falsiroseomonas tokyonensis]MBU8538253.1 hypothetical protein [Falsiroseomonas tokyonensis]
MRHPELLILLSAPPGPGWQDAAETLRQAGHLPIDAAGLERALAEGGPGLTAARRLARFCDAAVLLGAAPGLEGAFRASRRPVYAAAEQLRPAAPRPAPSLPWYALRSLDR